MRETGQDPKMSLHGPLILMGLGSAYERETKVTAY